MAGSCWNIRHGTVIADYPLFVTERNYGTTLFSIFINKAG